jgi:diacylglycerol O-acyltransferase / wax synthase
MRDDHSVRQIPLTAQDRAILRLEGRALVGHTCKVIVLPHDAPSLERLRDRVTERLDAIPSLGMRLGGTVERPTWVEDPDFDPRSHVVAGSAPTSLTAEQLRAEVGRLFTQRLARERPLWQIDVLARDGGGTALVWRLHHTLADGVTAMRYARTLLWDEHQARVRELARNTTDRDDETRRRTHMARFFAREFGRARSPFDGRIGAQREVAFASLPLARLRGAARTLAGATLNDAVLTVVAGALCSWLELHHGNVGQLRVKVPVSLHHQGDDAGNADSFFVVAVPLEHADAVERLRAVRAATAERKREHDAATMDHLLRTLRGASPELARICERAERGAHAFALNISNVPGPREAVALLGARVGSLHSIAEIAEHHAVRVAAVSLCDELSLGFCADPAIVPNVAWIAAACERAAGELVAAA